MSITRKTDVKNHLSARHRTEIHLEPAIQADATGFPHDEDAGADACENAERLHPVIVPPKSVQN